MQYIRVIFLVNAAVLLQLLIRDLKSDFLRFFLCSLKLYPQELVLGLSGFILHKSNFIEIDIKFPLLGYNSECLDLCGALLRGSPSNFRPWLFLPAPFRINEIALPKIRLDFTCRFRVGDSWVQLPEDDFALLAAWVSS